MKNCFLAVCCLFIVSTFTGTCLAHGVEGYAEKTEAWCITAQYDDGEFMSYAGVEVKAPGSDIAFQTGRTDRNGCFVFLPDAQGTWEVVVEDGMGHRLALDITVGGDNSVKDVSAPAGTMAVAGKNRPMGVVTGIAIIFGLCGILYGRKARRRDK